jgi:hypothetical protein
LFKQIAKRGSPVTRLSRERRGHARAATVIRHERPVGSRSVASNRC